MQKKDFTKALKKTFHFRGVDSYKVEITPYRDWGILVRMFFVALIISFGFNMFMSVKINNDEFLEVPIKTTAQHALNKDGLTKVLTEFAEKESRFENAKIGGVLVVDPSL